MENVVKLTPPCSRDWQQAMRQAVTRPQELLRLLNLSETLLPGASTGADLFPIKVPRSFVARMQPGDPNDPLLRQVLPLHDEARHATGFMRDPVGDDASMRIPGVLHKYRHRVLLIATGACAINCRYCFRRHFPYPLANAGKSHWAGALDYIRRDSSIHEVILSGGDPLLLATGKLAELSHALAGIPHLRRLRIHSRVPVVLPQRVDEELLRWLNNIKQQTVLVIHANHAQEFNADVDDAMAAMAGAGVSLFNQSVLLAGVNDQVTTLAALGERLLHAGVTPYYLHLLDRVQGAAHFQVPEKRARDLYRRLRAQQPGYLVPRLVKEVAGEPGKTLLL